MSVRKGRPSGRPIAAEPTPLQQQMIAIVESLAAGEVVSFGDVASRAGRPEAARAVGAVLANSSDTLPWWRVVYADGHLPPCNPGLQAQRLAEEGVQLRGYRVIGSPSGSFAGSPVPTSTGESVVLY